MSVDAPSRYLVFGATGAVGRALLPQLVERALEVHAVSRRPAPKSATTRLSWIHGDLFGAVAMLPSPVDAVISLGPLDAFAHWFEHQCPAGVRRVVALGSMSIDSKRDSADAAERALAERLRAAEERLARVAATHAIAWTILRPTLIYGVGMEGSLAPIARFARRWHVMPVPLGATGLRQPVHAADVALAVLATLDRESTFAKAYPLGGGERLRFDELLRRIGGAQPGWVLPLPLPVFALRCARQLRAPLRDAFSDAALERLRVALVADNSAAARDFDYAPRPFSAADVVVPQ